MNLMLSVPQISSVLQTPSRFAIYPRIGAAISFVFMAGSALYYWNPKLQTFGFLWFFSHAAFTHSVALVLIISLWWMDKPQKVPEISLNHLKKNDSISIYIE